MSKSLAKRRYDMLMKIAVVHLKKCIFPTEIEHEDKRIVRLFDKERTTYVRKLIENALPKRKSKHEEQ